MSTAELRQKLYEYVRYADDEKVKAFYSIIVPETIENTEWWRDKEVIADLEPMPFEIKLTTTALKEFEDQVDWYEDRQECLC